MRKQNTRLEQKNFAFKNEKKNNKNNCVWTAKNVNDVRTTSWIVNVSFC